MANTRRGLLWFRNDLRVEDNEALRQAAACCNELVPVFIWDPAWMEETQWGFPRMSARRVGFVAEALGSLRAALRARGSDLLVLQGRPTELLPKLAAKLQCAAMFWQREAAFDEVQAEARVGEACAAQGVVTHGIWGHTLHHIEDLPFDPHKLPKTFTSFRHKVERHPKLRAPSPPCVRALPSLPSIDLGALSMLPLPTSPAELLQALNLRPTAQDPRDLHRFRGQREAGLERMDAYIWRGDHLRHYKETRNGMLHTDDSSKLSPWLATGAVSPREIFAEVRRYEAERIANESTYWLCFELRWRDFFRFAALQAGRDLFLLHGPARTPKPWTFRERSFSQWQRGETGCSVVDAAMRELSATGFLSNRARQIAASYLMHELSNHWLAGAAWFESQLLDYDACSNYGNWAYIAGVGHDPRQGRHFDMAFQAARYDPDGAFQNHWLR